MMHPRTLVLGIAAFLSPLAAWAVTLECAPATGPAGGQATVEFRFTADEAESVGGTQNDIAFDAAVFDAANPLDGTPNCVLNPAIGPGTEPDKRLAKAFVDGPGLVRAIVFSQQNQIEIPPGSLYSCIFQIDDEADRRSYAVELLGDVVSDPAGDRLSSDVVSCAIEVTDPPTPVATPTPPGFCTDDEDCPDGQICVDNRCATITPTPIGYCEDEEDCPPGQICIDNRCATPIPTATPDGFCDDDEDCPDDSVCIDNRCATPTPIGFCEDEEDCAPGEVCIDNRCATPSPTPIGFCEDEDDCAPGEVCIDNRCATPTPTSGGGGGGCSCSVDPDPPTRAAVNLMLALLPVMWLRFARRTGAQRTRITSQRR